LTSCSPVHRLNQDGPNWLADDQGDREDGVRLLRRFVGSTTGKVAIAVLVTTAVAVPTSVWAVTSFSDVPTSHPFYKEISAVAGAGIAQGFGDGTYRPAIDITRQAMAAFMERGVGRAVSNSASGFVIPGDGKEIGAVTMDAGATGSGTGGFVHVSGSVWAFSSSSTTALCPCTVQVSLFDSGYPQTSSRLQVPRLPDGDGASDAMTVETVLPIQGDSTHRYSLVVEGINSMGFVDPLAFGAGRVSASGTIVATYFPLSGDGDNTAAYELTCPKDDGFEQNDTLATASQFFFTNTNAHAIVCPGDSDFYADQVAEGTRIHVVATFSNAEGNIDICLYKEGTLVDCSQGTTNGELIDYPSAPAGYYQIEVGLAADLGSVPGNTYLLSAEKF
jgi:hypothetical protein